MNTPPRLWSIGHGNRTIVELVGLLRAHGIEELVDVRRFPRSRRHPHFDRERLAESLAAVGIAYLHLEALGGMREPDGSATNAGVPDPALRGYADYMSTIAFAAALEELMGRAAVRAIAMMCAESEPRQCHRSMIADALAARGVEVRHIRGADLAPTHTLARAARIVDGRMTYPSAQGRLGL